MGPGWLAMGSRGGLPMGFHGGDPWDSRVGAHGIPGWAIGDPLALGDMSPCGPYIGFSILFIGFSIFFIGFDIKNN